MHFLFFMAQPKEKKKGLRELIQTYMDDYTLS